MTNYYRVKLNSKSKYRKDQKKNGYLAAFGEIQTYTKGEAMKKAALFRGTIEKSHEIHSLADLFSPEEMNELMEKTKDIPWCKCDPETVNVRDEDDGTCSTCSLWKHHYHCLKCGDIVQIG